jgi:hypothetical protein
MSLSGDRPAAGVMRKKKQRRRTLPQEVMMSLSIADYRFANIHQ